MKSVVKKSSPAKNQKSQTPASNLEEIFCFEGSECWSVPNALFRQGDKWFLGRSVEDAEEASLKECLEWYSSALPYSGSSTGDIVPLLKTVADRL